jgi:hypothetical protein
MDERAEPQTVGAPGPVASRSQAEIRSPLVPRRDKVFFAAVGALALWVGAWGFFLPTHADQALPWPVPPLHARFLGAMYLSGTAFMLGGLLARHWATIRVVVPMITLWTGGLLVVSVLHLSRFDPGRSQTWVWFAAYLAYPVLAGAIAWRMRMHREPGGGPALSIWLRSWLVGQGIVLTAVALWLLCLPDVAVEIWPWAITPLLAQLYGAPFLSYGLGSLYAARQRAQADVRLYLIGTEVFAAGVLLASVLHVGLFSPAKLVTWIWFGGLGLVAAVQGVGLAFSLLRAARSAGPNTWEAGR